VADETPVGAVESTPDAEAGTGEGAVGTEPTDAAGTGEGADSTEPTDAEAGTEPTDAKTGTHRARRAAVVLGAATVVLGAFGIWATVHANDLRSNATALANNAVTDGPATSAVRREITSAVNTVFSYNYANTAATRHAAQGVLTGPAIRQYNTYFALVARDAPRQKLVVTTRVTNSGVELLTGDRARVLVFANQQDTRAGTHQTSYAGALFAVSAVRQDGRWKIENINTFSGQQ
jgi:Mce-associated membrane protein